MSKLVIGSQMGEDYNRFLRSLDDVDIRDIPSERPWEEMAGVDVLWASPLAGWREADRRNPPSEWPAGLRWAQSAAAGVDAFPDWFFEGRAVTATRGNNAAPIADYVLLAILAHDKRWDEVRIHDASDWRWPTPALRRLEGETLAILGLGPIGAAIATRARAFGMIVKAYRRSDAAGPDGVTMCSDVAEAVADADHVAVAIAATAETRHIVGAGLMARMKRGVHIVNIARGSVLDQDALIAALDAGQVGAATLDVTDPEPLPAGHPLYRHPGVTVTPHISWSNRENSQKVAEHFAANIERFRQGQPLVDLVDRARGY